MTSLLEQAPDWLTRREYPPKLWFFIRTKKTLNSRRRIVFRFFTLTSHANHSRDSRLVWMHLKNWDRVNIDSSDLIYEFMFDLF